MKTNYLKLLIIQFLVIVGIAISTHALSEYRYLKIASYLLLVMYLSYHEFQYFRIHNKKAVIFFVNIVSIWVLFEGVKYLEFIYGFLPRLDDAPIFISSSLSLLAVFSYLGIILVANYVYNLIIKKNKL